jgi:hypothetical protein
MGMDADPLDLAALDGAATVQLFIVVEHPDSEVILENELELLPGGDGLWLVPVGIEAIYVGGCGFTGLATFTLLVDGEELLDDDLPPMTVEVHPEYGFLQTIELWDGWVIDINWGGWVA